MFLCIFSTVFLFELLIQFFFYFLLKLLFSHFLQLFLFFEKFCVEFDESGPLIIIISLNVIHTLGSYWTGLRWISWSWWPNLVSFLWFLGRCLTSFFVSMLLCLSILFEIADLATLLICIALLDILFTSSRFCWFF